MVFQVIEAVRKTSIPPKKQPGFQPHRSRQSATSKGWRKNPQGLGWVLRYFWIDPLWFKYNLCIHTYIYILYISVYSVYIYITCMYSVYDHIYSYLRKYIYIYSKHDFSQYIIIVSVWYFGNGESVLDSWIVFFDTCLFDASDGFFQNHMPS